MSRGRTNAMITNSVGATTLRTNGQPAEWAGPPNAAWRDNADHEQARRCDDTLRTNGQPAELGRVRRRTDAAMMSAHNADHEQQAQRAECMLARCRRRFMLAAGNFPSHRTRGRPVTREEDEPYLRALSKARRQPGCPRSCVEMEAIRAAHNVRPMPRGRRPPGAQRGAGHGRATSPKSGLEHADLEAGRHRRSKCFAATPDDDTKRPMAGYLVERSAADDRLLGLVEREPPHDAP